MGKVKPIRMVERICSIPGCDRKVKVSYLCYIHYYRLRKFGDPHAGKSISGSAVKFAVEISQKTGVQDCIIWPFGSSDKGYAKLSYEGRNVGAHLLVCELAHGPRPSEELHAAHSCGNKRCVNPNHLRWATPSENQKDRFIHGTSSRGERQWQSKLTEKDVLEIRAAKGILQADLADRYGVAFQTISKIRRRESWSWLM